jgi:hypothetical protein
MSPVEFFTDERGIQRDPAMLILIGLSAFLEELQAVSHGEMCGVGRRSCPHQSLPQRQWERQHQMEYTSP